MSLLLKTTNQQYVCKYKCIKCLTTFGTQKEKKWHQLFCGWNPSKLSSRQEDGVKCNHCNLFALPNYNDDDRVEDNGNAKI